MKRFLFSIVAFLFSGMAMVVWAQSSSDELNGSFTVTSDGMSVVFSKGNLQLVGENTYQFAEHQYEYFGNNQSQTANHRDLFSYYERRAPDDGKPWLILSYDEWNYLFNTRNVNNTLSSGARYTLATIGDQYKGVILFPDNYTHPDGTGFVASTYNNPSDFTATVSTEGWALMEEAGCVFFPATGYSSVDSLGTITYLNEWVILTSSTLDPDNDNHFFTYVFKKDESRQGWCHIDSRTAVRPVMMNLLERDAEGFYQISSLQDWKTFSKMAERLPLIKARMTADIDLGDDQTKISTSAVPYLGTFDGQGHTLTVHYVENTDVEQCSPFTYITGATIKNLRINGSITTAGRRPASISSFVSGTCNIKNCKSDVDITSTRNAWVDGGGLVARVNEGQKIYMQDCAFSGSITYTIDGGYSVGGLIGWCQESVSGEVSNCLFAPTKFSIKNTQTEYEIKHSLFVNNLNANITITNCYYTNVAKAAADAHSGWNVQGTYATESELADGTITTALQAGRTEDVWTQDLLKNQPTLKGWENAQYTVPASGIGSFSAKSKFTVPEGLDAYYCKTYDKTTGTIGVLPIDGVVPANTGVLLRGTPNETYLLTRTEEAATDVTDNALVAVTEQATIPQTDGEYTNFGMTGGVFKKVNANGGTVKANHAYLQILTSDLQYTVNSISLSWDDEVTKVVDLPINDSHVSGYYYDLQGRRVTKPARGLYIANGKKVMIK